MGGGSATIGHLQRSVRAVLCRNSAPECWAATNDRHGPCDDTPALLTVSLKSSILGYFYSGLTRRRHRNPALDPIGSPFPL